MLSILLSAVLAATMVPAAALAAPNEGDETNRTETTTVAETTATDNAAPEEEAAAGGELPADTIIGDESNLSIPAAAERVNEDVVLTSRTIAQAESTRSYFLAQTLESTRTVPIVSANLPLDTGMIDEAVEPVEGEGASASEDEGGEDSDESDLPSTPISSESIVVGSFEYRGVTYAVEPGGESVAVVAADYAKLPEEFIENQVIVLPSVVTAEGINYYSVTRIADNAFSTVKPQEGEEGITAITIPASVTEIGDDAFTDFDTLQYIIVSEDNPVYGMYDGCLYDADLTRLLLIPGGRLGAVCIAPSVETIDPEVFSHTGITEVTADADSAAYQLLTEGDLNYVSEKQILVHGLSPSEIASYELLDPILFADLIEQESGALLSSASVSSVELLDLKQRDGFGVFNLTELGLKSGVGNVYAVGKDDGEQVYEFYYVSQANDGYLWASEPQNRLNGSGNPETHFLDTEHPQGGGYVYYNAKNRTLAIHKSAAYTPISTGAPIGAHATYGLSSVLPTKATRTTYDGKVFQFDLEHADPASAMGAWVHIEHNESILLASDYYATYYVGDGEFLDWPWTYGERIAKSPVPKDDDYYFVGWFDEAQSDKLNPYKNGKYICGGAGDAQGNIIQQVPALSSNIKLYAHYALREHDVVFDANGGQHPESDVEIPVIWVKHGGQLPSEIKTTKTLNSPDNPDKKPYDPITEDYESGANKSGVLLTDAVAKQGDRPGYEFNGYWTTRYTEDAGKTETVDGRDVAPRQYYDKDMNPIGIWEETSVGATRLYAHWKYKVVLDLDTRDGDNNVVLNGDAYDASFDSMDGYATEYITVQDKLVKVYTFTVTDGDALVLPAKVSRTGYQDATKWNSAAQGGSMGLIGTLTAFYPGTELVTTQASAGDFGGKALVLRPDWTTTGAHGEIIPASKTYTVALQGQYSEGGTTFTPTNTYTTSINVLFDAPLLMQLGDKVIVYADYVKEDKVTEVAAPVIKNGNEFRYVFNGYYTDPNGLDMPDGGWNGAEYIGAQAVTGDAGYAGSTLVPTNVLFRTPDDSLVLYALWNRVESKLVLDLQGGSLGSLTGAVEVPNFKLTANEDVVELPSSYAQIPTREGYRFKGYYTKATDLTGDEAAYATYAETATTKAYYKNDGTSAAAESAKWPFYTNTVLYAHWEYDIECALVHADDCVSNPEGQHTAVGLKSGFAEGVVTDKYGNAYPAKGFFGTETDPYTITALAGVPVKLPSAQNRNGYSDTDSWNRDNGTSYANASSGYTASAADALYGAPDDTDKKMTLRANWGGKQKQYWVEIIDSTLIADGNAVTDGDLGGVSRYVKATFDAPLPISGLSVPTDANEDRNLAFLGYFSDPAAIGGAEAVRYVRLSGTEDAPVLATDAPFSPKGRSAWDTTDDKLESALVKEGEGAAPTTEKPIRIYAQWGYPVCRITFDMAGGTVGTHALSVVEDAFALKTNDEMPELSSLTGDAEALGTLPNKKSAANVGDATDYAFAGYWIGDTCYYSADLVPLVASWDRVGDATLTARWTYDIAYEVNAKLPQGAPASSDYWDHDMLYANGSALQPVRDVVDGTSPSVTRDVVRMRGTAPTGYAFAGWYTDADCEGPVAYNADGTLATELAPIDGTATLFAKWTPATYEVTLAASSYTGFVYGGNLQTVVNDSGENMRTKKVTATYDCPLPSETIVAPDMRGYSFLGYFAGAQRTAVSGASDPAPYAPGSAMFYSKSGAVQQSEPWTSTTTPAVLYAHYRQVPYAISFKLDDGASGSTEPVQVFYGFDLTKAKTHKASKNGFTFKGWKDPDPNANTVYFDQDGNGVGRYRLDRSIELVPVWQSKTYSITWTFNWDYTDDEGATIASWHHEKARPDDETFDGNASHIETVSYGDAIELLSPVSRAYVLHGWYTGTDDAYAHGTDGAAVGKVFQSDGHGGYVFAPADDSGPVDIVLFAGWDHEPIEYWITLKTSGHGSSFTGGATTKPLPNAYSATVAYNDLYDDVKEKNVPSATQAGWKFGGWIETTDGKDEFLSMDDRYVPRGTGNRTFEAVWVVTDAAYSISFDKGAEVRGDAPANLDAVGIKGSATRFFSAEGPTDSKGDLALPTLTPTSTLGYDFAGWFRAERDAETKELKFASDDTELRSGFSAQDLVDIAERYGNDLLFMAKWEPKRSFEVRYRWATGDAAPVPMDESAYDGRPVSYDATVELASPAFEQTGKSGYIFQYWDGAVKDPARAQKLLPGRPITVRDLVHELGKTSVETTSDGRNIVWLEPVWLETYKFTVPLRVDIIVDPERPEEGTKVTEGLQIKTTSPSELFVESVAFSRAANVSTTLRAKDADRSADVYLTLKGDGANATEPLRMNLGANAQKVYYGVDANGLGTLNASKPIELTYGIELDETIDRLTFGDFENLLGIKDVYDADRKNATYELGRVFYTLSLSSLRTPEATTGAGA